MNADVENTESGCQDSEHDLRKEGLTLGGATCFAQFVPDHCFTFCLTCAA